MKVYHHLAMGDRILGSRTLHKALTVDPKAITVLTGAVVDFLVSLPLVEVAFFWHLVFCRQENQFFFFFFLESFHLPFQVDRAWSTHFSLNSVYGTLLMEDCSYCFNYYTR